MNKKHKIIINILWALAFVTVVFLTSLNKKEVSEMESVKDFAQDWADNMDAATGEDQPSATDRILQTIEDYNNL